MVTMPLCFVKGCYNSYSNGRNGTTKGITFYSIPKAMESEWLTAIDRDSSTFIKRQKICSEHFNPDDFELVGGLRRIKRNAVPSRLIATPEVTPIPEEMRPNQPKGMEYKTYPTEIRKRKNSVTEPINKEIGKKKRQDGQRNIGNDLYQRTQDSCDPTDDVEVKKEIPNGTENPSVHPQVKEETSFDSEVKIEENKLDSCKSSPRSDIDEVPEIKPKIENIDPPDYSTRLFGLLTARLCDCKNHPNPDAGNRLVVDHPNLDLYKCCACDFVTNRLVKLRRHINFKHNDYLKISHFRCDICGFISSFAGNLRQHMLLHLHRVEVAYRCDKCPYETTLRGDLRYHRRTHSIKKEEKE